MKDTGNSPLAVKRASGDPGDWKANRPMHDERISRRLLLKLGIGGVTLFTTGCGGGGNTPGGNTPGGNTPGGNTPGGNTPGSLQSDGLPIYTETKEVRAGVALELRDPTRGISVVIPAAERSGGQITLTVRDTQYVSVANPTVGESRGRGLPLLATGASRVNKNAIEVTFTGVITDAVTDGNNGETEQSIFRVSIPWAHSYAPLATNVYFTFRDWAVDGIQPTLVSPLPDGIPPNSTSLTYTSAAEAVAFYSTRVPTSYDAGAQMLHADFAGFSDQQGSRGRQVGATVSVTILFFVFSLAESGPSAPPQHPTGIWEWNGETTTQGHKGAGNWQQGLGPTGKVAVIVHGMMSSIHEFRPLAKFISEHTFTVEENGSSFQRKTYDSVLAFGYDWTRNIRDNGELFAAELEKLPSNGVKVDIWAHSMGGLVSRWAIEKTLAGQSVSRLITLGTPHAGVPHDALINLIRTLSFVGTTIGGTALGSAINPDGIEWVTNYYMPGVADLLNDGPFLAELNAGDSPVANVVDYYLLAGNTHASFMPNRIISVGNLISPFYFAELDGIVPIESALAPLLLRKSKILNDQYAEWTHVMQTGPFNHNELHSHGANPNMGMLDISQTLKEYLNRFLQTSESENVLIQ